MSDDSVSSTTRPSSTTKTKDRQEYRVTNAISLNCDIIDCDLIDCALAIAILADRALVEYIVQFFPQAFHLPINHLSTSTPTPVLIRLFCYYSPKWPLRHFHLDSRVSERWCCYLSSTSEEINFEFWSKFRWYYSSKE